jgi:hypothetical protein
MITEESARRLLRDCASAREVSFDDGDNIVRAVSVAGRDVVRHLPRAIADSTPLWPPGSCNCGMTMWVQLRTWYPFAVEKSKKRRAA